MGRAPGAALLGALACLVAGCTSAPVGRSQADVPTLVRKICEVDGGIALKVHEFADAYNDGEHGLADRFFAPSPAFQWYSEHGLREGQEARDRSTLDAYLTRREQQADQLEILRVTPSGDGGDFAFTIRRGGEPVPSKGALDCRTGLFVVWSLGPDPGP